MREMLKLNTLKQLPLLNQSISDIHIALKSGKLTAPDLYQASLRRIKQTKILNAFITVPEAEAAQQAEASHRRFCNGNELSALDGIPISFKDNFSTKNILTTCASRMLHQYSPPFNATVVERLLDNGAILAGKTNMDEFAMGSACSESFFGPTYNPWNSNLKLKLCHKSDLTCAHRLSQTDNRDKWFIAGGSSGGSAVSVAIGASFAALSSDTGGSTRNPASRVGIVGFKPSYGLISRFGLIPLTHSLDVPGIMARNVCDVQTVFSHLHGVDYRDSTTIDIALKSAQNEMKFSDISIGIPDEYRGEFLCTDIARAWDEVTQKLIECGARVKRISLPHTKHSLPCYSILNACEVASNFACYDGIEYGYRSKQTSCDNNQTFEDCYTATREESFNDIVKSRIIAGNYFLLKKNYEDYYQKALRLRRLICDDFLHAFGEVDFLLTPVTITSTMNYERWSMMDKTAEAIKEDYCTQPANMAGVPAISVPVKLDSETKLPIGLQIIGKKFDDYRLLRFAAQLENLLQFPHLIFDE